MISRVCLSLFRPVTTKHHPDTRSLFPPKQSLSIVPLGAWTAVAIPGCRKVATSSTTTAQSGWHLDGGAKRHTGQAPPLLKPCVHVFRFGVDTEFLVWVAGQTGQIVSVLAPLCTTGT